MTLVVADAARSFVMHHKPESLGMGIGIESIDVEIRIRCHEIEDIVLAAVGPVLPADVPAFDQDCIKTVLRSEVDVLSDIVVVGAVPSVRFRLRIVDRTELDRRDIGVGPASGSSYHLPPDTHVLDRVDPADILDGTWLVEIEDKTAGKLLCGAAGHLDGSPWGIARGLHVALPALCVRGKEGTQSVGLPVDEKMHARIVHKGCLVDIHIIALVALHLEGCLDSAFAEESLGIIAPHVVHEIGFDLAQTADFIFILLGIEIPRNPPGGVVGCHGELGKLFFDNEVDKIATLREFVTEAESVVEKTETDVQKPGCFLLDEMDQKLVVMVAYRGFLSPDRRPRLVKAAGVGSGDHEVTVEEVAWTGIALRKSRVVEIDFPRLHGAPQLETETSRVKDRSAVSSETVAGNTLVVKGEFHLKGSVRAGE